MKTRLLLFIVFTISTNLFSQIGFETNVVIDEFELFNPANTVEAEDLDSDGDLDLILFDSFGDRIIWLENTDGLGTFIFKSEIAQNSDHFQIADFDLDGDLDLIASTISVSSTIDLYENIDGQGNFEYHSSIATLMNVESILSTDVDNDGDIDIISGLSNAGLNNIYWYENMGGEGNFSDPNTIDTDIEGNVRSILSTDVDNDGDLDLIYTSLFEDTVFWYENLDGFGVFGSEIIITSNSDTTMRHTMSLDIDNDEDNDIVLLDSTSQEIIWLENSDGLGTFDPPQEVATSIGSIFSFDSYDMDNDGDLDIIAGIKWYENTSGDGVFDITHTIASGLDFVNINSFVGDIDNDNLPDIIPKFRAEYYLLGWFQNTPEPDNFIFNRILTNSIYGDKVIDTADIDGDGDMDVLCGSDGDRKVTWFENLDGLGNFDKQKIIDIHSSGFMSNITTLDHDGDDDLDVLVATSFGVLLYENLDGQGNFGEYERLALFRVDSALSADMDGDGDEDIVYSKYTSSILPDEIRWMRNLDGLGDFSDPIDIVEIDHTSNLLGSSAIALKDLDGDSDFDIVFFDYNDSLLGWVENLDGLGDFSDEIIIPTSFTHPRYFYIEDIDRDNDLDIVMGSESFRNVVWFENLDGMADFSSAHEINRNSNDVGVVIVADLDGDHFNDVLYEEFLGGNYWKRNIDGLGTFGDSSPLNFSVDGVSDIDGNGLIDILSKSSSGIYWQKNVGLQSNEINGVITADINSDGCDASDYLVPNILVTTTDGTNNFGSFSYFNGFYQLYPGEGNFTTAIASALPNYYTSTPVSQDSNFTGIGNTDTIDFCLEPIGVIDDLNISVYPSLNDLRPGFNTGYRIVFNNVGTTQLSGSIVYEYDETKLSFLSSSEAIASQTSNTITFDLIDLNPFETREIDLFFDVFAPPTTNIGDVIISTATVNPVSGDETEDDNVFSLDQIVIGSYDPNDIRVLEGEEILYEDADKYLHYIIRFQNTGTASAINVRVENVLDNKLDWTTMRLESLSHTGRVEIIDGRNVKFIFDNINLLDSTNDEPNSHGFIAYKIKPKDDVVVGDIFYNTANIFFDFNPAIVTNTVSTEIVENLSVDEYELQNVSIYPNPTNNILHIEAIDSINSVELFNLLGQTIYETTPNTLTEEIDISRYNSGMYLVKVEIDGQVATYRVIKQ